MFNNNSKKQNSLNRLRTLLKFSLIFTALAAILIDASSSANAQTAKFKSSSTRITLPPSFAGGYAFTNSVSLSGNAGIAVDFTVSGLPAGASVTITDTNGNALPVDTATGNLPSSSTSTNILLTFSFNNVANGLYPLLLNASGGATNSWPFFLQVGAIWSGSLMVSGNWSSPSSWVNGGIPGASDDVIFTQLGAQTNAVTGTSFSFTNSIVDANFTISSLRFSQTNSGSPATNYHNILINPGVTLSITGTNGLRMLRDYIDVYAGLGGALNVNFFGSGATLLVSNESANIAFLVDNQITCTMNMSNLDTFISDVNQVGLGDCSLYPGFRAYQDGNGYNGVPNKFIHTVYFAKTNVIRAVYVDANNYTNADSRHYALSFARSEITGSSTQPNLYFGITNQIFADGVNFVGANQSGNVQFNPAFVSYNPGIYFRNTNGGRMSTFAVADSGSTNTINSNVKGFAYWGNSGGYVDMLVDRFYLARDSRLIAAAGTPNIQGQFSMGKGIVDANTAILGYQQYGGHTNTAANFLGYCQGTLVVSNTGVFKVNNSLTLGYTAETNPNGQPYNTKGIIYGLNGGTIIANNIIVDGGVNLSTGNLIALTNGNLTVSNSIGNSTRALDTLSVNGGSTVTLNLNGTNSNAYAYLTNLVSSGNNTIQIASIKNLGSFSGNIPLVYFSAGNGSFSTLIMPSGLNGALITSNNIGIWLTVLTNSPKQLLWRGYVNQNWDLTTANWLDQFTGLQTNFANGDYVGFDDNTSVTTIHLAGPVDLIPGAMAMTNNINNYVIDSASGGDIQGSSTLTKWGTAPLEIDATTTMNLQINQGSLIGSGFVNLVNVGVGAMMSYSGTASAVICAGVGVNNGTIASSLTISPNGVFTNFNNLNGVFIAQTNSFFYNAGTITYVNSTSATATNSVVINGGVVNGDVINVGGTFEDLGGSANMTLTSFSLSPGGLFIPGGDGIGTTTIYSDNVGNFPGAVLLTQGSTTLFKVNLSTNPSNTVLTADHLSFGASASVQTQNGATLLITNVGSIPFSAGQTFQLFNNVYINGKVPFSTGSSSNTFPVISPSIPGPGLAWDLTRLFGPPGYSGPSGLIGIVSSTSGPVLTNNFTLAGTNIIAQFSWDPSYLGYRLLTEVNPLSVGLTLTNWTGVSGSQTNTMIIITNTVGSGCVFYRLAFP